MFKGLWIWNIKKSKSIDLALVVYFGILARCTEASHRRCIQSATTEAALST